MHYYEAPLHVKHTSSTYNTSFVLLTIPLGPSVLFTKSPIAPAIKEDYRRAKNICYIIYAINLGNFCSKNFTILKQFSYCVKVYKIFCV